MLVRERRTNESIAHPNPSHAIAYPRTYTQYRFLSALAVVAERPDLINRVLITQTGPAAGGMYGARLFIDGRWQVG